MSRMRVLSVGFVAVGALLAAACTTGGGGGGGPTGTPPVAVIGADHSSGVAPLTVSFTSAGSTDADGTITARAWNFGDPSSASNAASTTVANHTFANAGTYTVTLLVTDNSGMFNSAQTTIVVTAAPVNLPPVAVATPSTLAGKAPLAVTFTGDTSSDPDGTVVSHLWTFDDVGSGALNTATTANASHTFSAAGTYIVSLKVTDNLGATNTVTTAPIVVSPNQAPSASASGTPLSGKEPLDVAFSSAGTSDPDDATPTLTYSWNFGDGSALSTAANPSHTYTTAVGSPFTATLTVTDPYGASDQKTVVVGVNANQPPNAVANADVTAGIVPLVVNFSGASSNDDGIITSYLWTFAPGFTSTLMNPQFTFGTTGPYPVTLTVTDDNGVTDTDTININVNPVPNVPPIAVASVAPASGKQGTVFQFTGDQSSDPDNTPGPPITYLWDFGDGNTSTLANPSHAFSVTGNRTVQLQVKDAANGTNTTTVQVQVDLDQPPTAVANGTPLTGKAPLLVSFSSAGTADADDATPTLTYLWTFTGGSTSTLANPTFNFATAGTKTATLRVTDPFGKFDENTVTVNVAANQNPVAVANGSPGSGLEDLTVAFSSAGTADPDDALGTLTYAWDFGDPTSGGANTSTSANPSHTYATPGTFTATLTVTDPYGGTNGATAGVTVYADADGDLYSPNAAAGTGVDCNDNSSAINPGAADTLDTTATDSNCDGYDGVASDTVFVSATGSDTTGSGTGTSPYQTLTKALTVLGSRHVIQVTNGASFAGFAISGTSGLTIRGGFASDFTSRTGTTTVTGGVTATSASSLKLEYLTINGAGGLNTTGVLLTSATNPTLSFLTIASGTASGAGSSAYGLRAVSSTGVTINNSAISASGGIAGTAGTTQSAATNGANGTAGAGEGNHGGALGPAGGSGSGTGGAGGAGGTGGCHPDGNTCPSNHPKGFDGANGSTGAAGGAAGGVVSAGNGTGGDCGCYAFDFTGDPGTGAPAGAAGAAGAAGTNSGPADASYGTTYAPISGGAGTAGKNGGGGAGGGGGGEGCNAGGCIGNWYQGGGGGSGGQGGTGGLAGNVGTGGGGSFAVYSFNSSVTIDANTTLSTGNGGTGGNGAVGQGGGTGGTGGKGGNASSGTGGNGGGAGAAGSTGNYSYSYGVAGSGGGGGGGGNGGVGGAGGGGAGGSSVAMLNKGSGSITFAGNLSTQVTIGAGGAAGTGGSGSPAAGTAVKQKNVA